MKFNCTQLLGRHADFRSQPSKIPLRGRNIESRVSCSSVETSESEDMGTLATSKPQEIQFFQDCLDGCIDEHDSPRIGM